MKKLNLTDKQKLYIKIGLIVLYFTVFLLLILNGASHTSDGYRDIIEFDRTAFTIKIFGFERDIYFYALSIITGIGFAYLYAIRIAKKLGFSENNLFDGFIIGVVIGIVGARIWYVIFEWDSFKNNLLEIITEFRGLAIHGAVIAAGIFAYFFCRWKKEDPLVLGEMLFPGFLIGQIFGRWGNFFNKEAHGGPIGTLAEGRAFLDKLPIPRFIVDQMYIAGNYVHPTFLYESVWNLIGLILIIVLRNKTKKYWYGDAIPFYLVWYGIGRFFVESIRTDALTFELFNTTFRTAQVTSILMILGGLVFFILRRVYKYKPISYLGLIEEVEEKNKLTGDAV